MGAGGLVVSAIALSACGGSASSAPTSTTKATTTTVASGRGAALAAFTACMKQQGVPITLPTRPPGSSGTGGGGFSGGGGGGFGGGGFGGGGGSSTTASGGTDSSTPSSTPGGSTPSSTPGGRGAGGFFSNLPLPPGVTQAQMNAAMAKCRSSLPTGGPGGAGGAGGFASNPALQAAFTQYATCMSANGYPNFPTSYQTALSSVDRTSQQYITANNACKQILTQAEQAAGLSRGSTTTTSTPTTAASAT